MIEPYNFVIRRKVTGFEELANSECRISAYRAMTFLGGMGSLLVLYKVERWVNGEWVRVVYPNRPQDQGWFGFAASKDARDVTEWCKLCHRHFTNVVMALKEPFTVRQYLEMYKQESVKAQKTFVGEHWDTTLHQTMKIEDNVVLTKTYGSFKVRGIRGPGDKPLKEPFKTGVILTYFVKEPTIEEVILERDRRLLDPRIFERGFAMENRSLALHHAIQPKG